MTDLTTTIRRRGPTPGGRPTWLALALSTLAAAPAAGPARADEGDPPGRAARTSFLRGDVAFSPAGGEPWIAAVANWPLTTGDRLRTAEGGRAELGLGSVTIRLGGETDAAFLVLSDRRLRLRVSRGTVTVTVRRLHGDEVAEVVTPHQASSIQRPGRYRVEARPDGGETLVTVHAGAGEAGGGGGTFAVQAGQALRVKGIDRPEVSLRPAGSQDDLDRWSQVRDLRSLTAVSARYVSREVVGYEDLDDHGAWSTDPDFGHVWYPARPGAGWAPYRAGRWAWIAPWGRTWVDDAPWGYAPSHYGRWATIRGRWAWVPGPTSIEAVYAPALIASAGGPDAATPLPLGPREIYLPAFAASRDYLERINRSNARVPAEALASASSGRPGRAGGDPGARLRGGIATPRR